MHRLILLVLFCFVIGDVSACNNAYQFKIFPVGVAKGKIISIDFQIQRTSAWEGMVLYSRQAPRDEERTEDLHVIRTFSTAYDMERGTFSTTPIDTNYVYSDSYADELNEAYRRLFEQVIIENPELERFDARYLSYGASQDKLDMLSIEQEIDSIPILIMNGIAHRLTYLTDSSYHATQGNIEMLIPGYTSIGSVRRYQLADLQLVVAHLATGTYHVTWNEEDGTEQVVVPTCTVIEHNEPFSDICTETYAEPMLHHGYGVDVFVIR